MVWESIVNRLYGVTEMFWNWIWVMVDQLKVYFKKITGFYSCNGKFYGVNYSIVRLLNQFARRRQWTETGTVGVSITRLCARLVHRTHGDTQCRLLFRTGFLSSQFKNVLVSLRNTLMRSGNMELVQWEKQGAGIRRPASACVVMLICFVIWVEKTRGASLSSLFSLYLLSICYAPAMLLVQTRTCYSFTQLSLGSYLRSMWSAHLNL